MSALETGDADMRNDRYSPSIDPLRSGAVLGARGWSAMLPSFISPSQAVDRLARLEEARSASLCTDGAGSMRLARAGYLLIVGTGRLVCAVAADVRRIARGLMKPPAPSTGGERCPMTSLPVEARPT